VTLLYDGDCGFCTRAARLADRALSVDVVPLQTVDLAALGVDANRAREELPFRAATGEVSYGSDAIAAALIATGGLRAWLGRVMLARPVRIVARAAYRLVSRNRGRLPGGTPACAAPDSSTW
jgi:predicted DCC family thiol-disulfide oxidoreductase YuxK